MFRYDSPCTIVLVAVLLSACGTTHSTIVKQPESLATVKIQETSLGPIQVNSTEQDPDSLALNERWSKLMMEELQSLLANKKISENANANTAICCRINITYGSQALRYWVGFGAGAGSIDVTLELRDASGNSRYATNSRADLKIGAFGGDMPGVIRDSIQKAVSEFGSRL
jgi:hypothetical protein